MRYRFLFLLLLLSLSACTFQVDVLTPEPPKVSESVTTTSLPAFTFTQTITPSPSPKDLGITPIRFAPNGTYIDIVDTVLAGTNKTYSINALKGQVMSISVHQNEAGAWTVVPLKIVGADNTILCPQKENQDCEFWRGILPASQDYFVTLTPVTDVVDFTMRVAINPPGTPTQSFQYLSSNGKASFSYSDEFAPVRFPSATIYKVVPEIALEFIDTQYYTNTNLSEAYFLFGSTNESNLVENCMQPVSLGGPESIIGEVNINGINFVRSEGNGVALGNIYEQIYHRVVYHGICYEAIFFIHYGNMGAYAPETGVKEFDRATLIQKFESILSSLIIK